ncbi:hypothetical protein ACFWDG_13695 [Peribacillus sp. NPDC060186]
MRQHNFQHDCEALYLKYGALAEDRSCLKVAFSLWNYRGRLVQEA